MIVAHQNLGLHAAVTDKRFTDQKLNAMREAAVAANWRKLFSIAPRGCVGPAGPTMADGSRGACGDDPSIPLGSPEGEAAYYYWNRTNPLRKNLTINDLRVYLDDAGNIRTKRLTEAEVRDFFVNFQWARHDWKCTEGQLEEYIQRSIAGTPIYPLAQCAQSSRSRRRKILKKVGAVAGVALLATAGVMFGKAILSKVLAGAAKAGSAIGATAGAALKQAPSAAKIINSGATVKAVLDGKQPPPPISFGDGTLSSFASTVGLQIAERELGRQLSQQEEAYLLQQIELQRRQLAQYEPRHAPVVNTGLDPVLTAAQRTRADAATDENKIFKYAVIGIPLAMFALRGA